MLDASTTAAPRQTSIRWAVVAGVGALALAVSSLGLWLTSRDSPAKAPRALSPAAFFEATGVNVVRIAVVGGGGVVDVRYQAHVGGEHSGEATIALLDEETGLLLADGVHGKHSASSARPEAVRYVLLANTGGALEPGDTASVVVGDFRLEHVLVR